MGTGGPEQLHPLTRLHTTNLLPAVSLPLYLTLTSKFQAPGANFQFLFRRLLLLHLFFLLIIIIIPPPPPPSYCLYRVASGSSVATETVWNTREIVCFA